MSIGEEQVECPLCMEPLELDDINFFPCTCGYQICRFCWHRIRTDENGLCPACRKAYPEDPAQFKPLTEDEFSCHRLQRIKRERKAKDLQRKQKAAENRKHLANVRVVQKNLVFVVGLSQRLGDTEVLKKQEYFGKYGKILKVVINQSTSYAGSQGPSASAYVTYVKPEDALRAIQAVNNIHVDGRTLKASLGTTKYCSHFLRGTQCPKGDCMYLHELGDEAASFTKDEMQQGKHQEYEQKLYEQYMNHLNNSCLSTTSSAQTTGTQSNKATSRKKCDSPGTTQRQTPPSTSTTQSQPTDTWPTLQTGPTSSQGNASKGESSKALPPTNTHKRSTSTDLQNIQTPDNSNRPSPQLDTSSNSSSSSSTTCSSSQPQVSPPVTTTTQASVTQVRKPLYRESLQHNMSLFSSSGFPSTRNPLKPPPQSVSPSSEKVSTAADSGALTHPAQAIPDTIPQVASSTDWQAAFGFQPSAHNPSAIGDNLLVERVEDDLGFDPWNESQKALQDLIEKEAVSTSHQHQNNHHHVSTAHNSHLGGADRTKQLPPGFAPNHISAFNQTPMLGASRMMNLMKISQQPAVQQPEDLSAGPAAAPPPLIQQHPPAAQHNNTPTHHYQHDPFTMKSWQEGLKALFPNVNIHIGGFPGGSGQPQPPHHNPVPQPPPTHHLHTAAPPHNHQPTQHHTQQMSTSNPPHSKARNTHNSWDLSYDPAIVTSGQITDTNLLEEPHWMASIHHLTEEPANQAAASTSKLNGQQSAPAPPPGFQNHTIHKLVDGFQ